MLTKTTRLALALAVLAASLLSFLALRAYEQFADGVDWDWAVATHQTVPGLSNDEYIDRVQAAVATTDATVWHLVNDREQPDARGVLYVASAGTPSRDWADTGRYPSFTRGLEITVKPLSELGGANRAGYYFVHGDRADADAVAQGLNAMSKGANVIRADRANRMLTYLVDVPIVHVTSLVVFLLVLLAAAGVITGARAVGILQLQGRSFSDCLVSDSASAARTLVVLSAGHLALSAIVLGVYNHWHWWGLFLMVQSTIALVCVAIIATVHAATMLAVRQMDLLARVKGEMRSRPIHFLTYGARLAACAMALGSVALVAQQSALAQAKSNDAAVWETTRGNVQFGLAGKETEAAQRASDTKLGTWLEAQDRAGNLIYVHRDQADQVPGLGLPAYDDVLTVNSTYLRERPLRDVDGRTIAGPRANEVLLLVPRGSAANRSALRKFAVDAVEAELYLRNKWSFPTSTTPRTYRLVETAPAQQAFAYLDPVWEDRRPWIKDPVLIVIPSSAQIYAPTQWAAFMSSGKVILKDKDKAVAALNKAGLSASVASVEEVEVTNALQSKEINLRANLYRLNLIAVLAALITTALGFAVVHSRRFAKATFAQHIHGWSFLRRHRLLFALDIALVTAVVGRWAASEYGDRTTDIFTVPTPPPPLWVPLATAAAGLVALTASLSWLDHTLVKRRAAD